MGVRLAPAAPYPMAINIRDEVASLCDSCKDSHIIVDRHDRRTVVCQENTMDRLIIRTDVRKCNKYRPVNSLEDWQAQKIGWVLEVKRGKVVGFRPPAEDKE